MRGPQLPLPPPPSGPQPPSFLGSGPDRGRSPVEWGDFPYVRLFVHTSVRPSVRSFVRPITGALVIGLFLISPIHF